MSVLTDEEVLNRLGYVINDAVLSQYQEIKSNTKDFDKVHKHLVDLHEKLKHLSSYVAMSNSKNYFKVKHDNTASKHILEEFHSELEKWSLKYKVAIEKVKDKETYYVLGYNG